MINDLQGITTAYYKGLLTPNECRVMLGLNPVSVEESIFKSGGPFVSRDSGVKQMTIRRAVACVNCGSTQYENGVCSFCGTIYEERNGRK